MQITFETRLNLLSALSHSWDRNALFNQVAKDLIREVHQDSRTEGIDRVALAGKLGGLQGAIADQEQWIRREAERVVSRHENPVRFGWVN